MSRPTTEQETKIVDLAQFRQKKSTAEELARGREPLYVSHRTGKISSDAKGKKADSADFGDRLQRIRASLDKINRLMSELKRMSTGASDTDDAKATPRTDSKK